MIDHTSMINQPVSSPFYITGGTLRGDAASYVIRRADQELYDCLCQSQFCYVLTSRQMGKSSLMIRTAARLRENGIGVVVLDLTAVGQNLTAEQWYDGLLSRIGRQLQLEEDLEKFWFEHPRLGPLQRWMSAISEVVLPRYPGNLVIFIDEIDTVRSLPFSTDEFFAGIRELYNRRTAEPELERLTFCLLGVASPSDLIRDTRMTPFNIGQRIELHDFTADEVRPLAQGLGRESRTGGELLGRVLHWTGGHPYLTQRLCRAIAEDESVSDANGVDAKCKGLFLASRAQEGDDNLLFVRERMLRSEVELAGLLTLYDQVHRGKKVRDDETNQLVSVLRLSGITRVDDGSLKVRNRIYDRVFDSYWVNEHMPDAELRRQQAAYRKGLMRAAGVAAVIMAIITGLAFLAFQQRNIAKAEAERADQNFKKASLSDEQARKALLTAEEQRKEAVSHQMIAQEQRDLARNQEETNRRQLYAAQMNLARQAWDDAGISTMVDLLNNHIPKPGQKDLRGFEWYYLNGLADSSLRTIRHGNSIYSAKFLNDNKRVVTASDDGVVRVWDIISGKEVLKFIGHAGGVLSVAVSPDNRMLASAGEDMTVRLWDLNKGTQIASLQGHKGHVRFVVFSRDGKKVASASSDRTSIIWDSGKKTVLHKLQHKDEVTAADFSPDNKKLVTTGNDGSVNLWDTITGKNIVSGGNSLGSMYTTQFSPDGSVFVTGDGRSTIIFWDAHSGKTIMVPGPNNNQLVTKLIRDGHVMNLAFSPSGRYLAAAFYNRTVRLYSPITLQLLNVYKGHGLAADSVAFSPNEKLLVSSGRDGIAKIWDLQANQEESLYGAAGSFKAAFSPDGCCLATGSVNPNGAILWNMKTRDIIHRFRDEVPDSILTVAFSPDGQRLATGGKNSIVQIWNVVDGREIGKFKGHNGWITSSGFSPDGKILATGSFDKTVRLWSVHNGQEIHVFDTHNDIIDALSFSPDGRYLASASSDKTVKIWNINSKKIVSNLTHTHAVHSLSFSPDGKFLAAATSGGYIKLWDISTQREIRTFSGHVGGVNHVIYSPNGRQLISGGGDGYIKFWDVETGQEVYSEKQRNQILAIALSPDGKTLVSSYGSPMKIWVAGKDSTASSKIALLKDLSNSKPIVVGDFPVGWRKSGNGADLFSIGIVDDVVHGGSKSCIIHSNFAKNPTGDVFVHQSIKVHEMSAKRLRFSGYIKRIGNMRNAWLSMHVQGPGYTLSIGNSAISKKLNFDEQGWERVEVVLDIPQESVSIDFGLNMSGPGTAWFDDLRACFKSANQASRASINLIIEM